MDVAWYDSIYHQLVEGQDLSQWENTQYLKLRWVWEYASSNCCLVLNFVCKLVVSQTYAQTRCEGHLGPPPPPQSHYLTTSITKF